MNNLNLKSKLVLLLLFPILGLLFLSITISYDRYLIYSKLEKLNNIVLLSTKTKTLIYSLQKERGLSNGYLGSEGKGFKEDILSQRIETIKQKKEFNHYLKTIDIKYYGEKLQNTISRAVNKLNKIEDIRSRTISLNINEEELNTYYTKLIEIFIETITLSSDFSSNKTLSKELYSYSNLVYAIEKAANERGLGTLAFASKELSFQKRNQLHDLILEQNIYLSNFEKSLSNESYYVYKGLFKGKVIDESIRMRRTLLNSIKKKLIILRINKLIGYGGIIHYLNNYQITKDKKYINKIKKQYKQLLVLLKEYASIKHISLKEKDLLSKIKIEFNSYIENIDTLSSHIEENDTLNILTNENFFLDDSTYWFETMTSKIAILQKMSNKQITQILKDSKIISNSAKSDMIFYIVSCIFILIAVLFIGRNISINIVNSVNELLLGIDRFFRFVNKKSNNIQLIDIQSNDEIGIISKIINDKISISKKIIDEDIIERAKELELEVKRKTNDLKTKNKEYEILLDRFTNHVIATRTDTLGIITFATDKFCETSGYSKEELLGQNHNIVRHPDIPKTMYKELWENITSGKNYIGEVKNRRKDGSEYWIKLIIVPEYDTNGNIIGYFSVKENIDDKIKIREFNEHLEEKVKDAIDENRKKDELLSFQSKQATMGEMVGIIAHQWKQPLSSLSMRIQSIKYKKEINAEYKEEFVNDNMHLIQFMSRTIDDFRDFFRQDKKKEDFNVLNCINKTLNIVNPQLVQSKINITVDGVEFMANGLQSEFQQVIVNLITNAKDVLIEKEIKDRKIEIETKIEGSKGILTINDNAGGVPASLLEKIFEPYFTTKEIGKGTGIGLYISKTIIEETMNGELEVHNTKEGASFRIILPRI